jgi:hypothetical protein
MSERAYNRLANTFMLIGVASALVFDSGKFPRALVGTIGILAGVAAIALYFWNQLAVKEKQKAAVQVEALTEHVVPESITQGQGKTRIPVSMDKAFEDVWMELAVHNTSLHAVVMPRAYKKLWLTYDEDLQAIQAYRKETAKRFLRNCASHHARTLQWHMVQNPNMALMKPEVELSANEVAVCAAEIIRNLALIEGVEGWDYSFGPNGLHVSMKRTKAVRPVAPQEDFEFDFLSSLAV